MSNQIKLLTFDLDDTLWPCAPTIQYAEKVSYAWMVDNVPVICTKYSLQDLYQKRLKLANESPGLSHDLTDLRKQSLYNLAEEFDLDSSWVEPAFMVFYQARQEVTLFDDVSPTMDYLIKDYCLIALTNGNANIKATGVEHWFDFAISAAEAGAKKSEPIIFHQAAKRTGFLENQAVHIGDDPIQDVYGAQQAGFLTIWLNRDNLRWQHDFQPDAVIASLSELPKVLAELG